MKVSSKININATVDYHVAVAFSNLSALGFLFVLLMLCVYSRKENITSISRKGSIVVLVFVALLSLVSSLIYSPDYKVVNFVWGSTIAALSTISMVWGSSAFFQLRETEDEEIAGVANSRLSVFICIVCIAISGLELLIFVGSFLDSEYLNCLLFGLGMVQKATQVWIYHFKLRHLKPKINRLTGASWYFKTIVLVNFILWVESIEVTKEEQTRHMENVLKDGYNIFSKAYTALIVDFRLICCIVFVEHALAIDHEIPAEPIQNLPNQGNPGQGQDNQEEDQDKQDIQNDGIPDKEIVFTSFHEYEKFQMTKKQNIGLAFLFGLILLFLQILSAMQYNGKSNIGPWANMTEILAEWLTIMAGFALTKKIKKKTNPNHAMAMHDGIEYLMVFMGLFSAVFWTVKSVATAVWTWKTAHSDNSFEKFIHNYLIWTTVKNMHRPFSHLFFIYVFVKIDMNQIYQNSFKKSTSTYFFVPFIILSSLCLFFNLITDEYVYYVEELVHEADFSTVLKVIYAVGSPISLGFVLHIFVHFFIISSEMNKYVHIKPTGRNDPDGQSSTSGSTENLDKLKERLLDSGNVGT